MLMLEDCASDAELNVRALERAGFDLFVGRADCEASLADQLTSGGWDLILSDYAMCGFDAPHALEVVHRLGVDVPFILISGTVEDDDAAIAVMRQGAHDYLFKGKLLRLGAVVERELEGARARRRRREAEEALRQSERRHRLLVEESFDIVTIIDREGKTVYVSPAVERTLGYKPEELLGVRAFEIVHPDDREVAAMALAQAFASVDEPVTVRMRLLAKNGAVHFVETVATNHFADPAIEGLMATTRDISERHAIEEERRARVQAETASSTKSAFLANMSHELRTPLNAIIGFSELLEQGIAGAMTERQSLYVRNVVQSGRHLLNLVNDILDLSKIEAGKMSLSREWMDLGSVFGAIDSIAAPLAEARKIELHVSTPDLPMFWLDPVRVKQILYNLVSNGIKFTPEGGRVSVTARTTGPGLELRVSDTGVGIRAEDRPRLFEAFERLEPIGMQEKPEGTGLGLSVTRRLVEMHGGRIDVESTVGKGSTFTVTIPNAMNPINSGPPSVGSRRVLEPGE